MKVEYICHACLMIDTGDVRIVTDPWFNGPAYCNQWHVFPRPVNVEGLSKADYVLISHGHEDHLHEPTLKDLPKTAKVFYPYHWYGGTKQYLESMGFEDVREAATFKTYRLTGKTSITFVAINLDSIIVIESNGRVLVDVNDAMHALHPNVIAIFAKSIKKRWPKIDTVFCGFGGASYFPNTLHLDGKDDRDIGALREQLFAHNFCKIVRDLEPDVAVPFAADFALLGPGQRWINDVRFNREHIAEYYEANFGKNGKALRIYPMYPGDVLDDNELRATSPYRQQMRAGGLGHLIDEQYAENIADKRNPSFISEESAGVLREEILKNITERATLFPSDMLSPLTFSIHVTDVGDKNYYNVRFDDSAPRVERSQQTLQDAALRIDISSEVLRYSFSHEWGGDAVIIGYGAELHIANESVVEKKLDTLCIRLLTRHPSTQRHFKQAPVRVARALLTSPLTRRWAIRRFFPGNRDKAIYDQKLWLSRSKCDICQICDMPLLDAETSAQL